MWIYAIDAALTELVSCSGTQFDPRVVEALLRVVERDERPIARALAAAPSPAAEHDPFPGAPTPARVTAF